MAIPQSPPTAALIVAVFSRHASAIEWTVDKLEKYWGPVALTSSRFQHTETNYYTEEMGLGLSKQFFVIDAQLDPADLASLKLESNDWEQELARQQQYTEQRPINVDPGYLTLSKLVLASAKDRAHRIYLRDGIYGEECLYYLGGAWRSRPWTYPDYQRADFQAFFSETRDWLKQRISLGWGSDPSGD